MGRKKKNMAFEKIKAALEEAIESDTKPECPFCASADTGPHMANCGLMCVYGRLNVTGSEHGFSGSCPRCGSLL